MLGALMDVILAEIKSMDPGWVGSPLGSLKCVLCGVLLPRYAESFFRHLIGDHRTHHNLK